MPDLLTSLCRLDDALRRAGLVPDLAFAEAAVLGTIELSPDGEVLGMERSYRRELLPRLPARTSAIVPAFMSGTAPYWTGGEKARDRATLAAMRELHECLLARLASQPAVAAVLALLSEPRGALDAVRAVPGALVVRVGETYPHRLADVRAAWEAGFVASDANPLINVAGSPVRLTSSNLDSARSYGRDGVQLPPGVSAAAYGRALNWLLARPGTRRIGDTAFAAWCDGAIEVDPMPFILPPLGSSEPFPDWPGAVHLVAIQNVPPGRAAQRLYAVADGGALVGSLRSFYDGFELRRGLTVLPWHHVLPADSQAQSVAYILAALVEGRPAPPGIVTRVLQGLRRSKSPNSAAIGLLEHARTRSA